MNFMWTGLECSMIKWYEMEKRSSTGRNVIISEESTYVCIAFSSATGQPINLWMKKNMVKNYHIFLSPRSNQSKNSNINVVPYKWKEYKLKQQLLMGSTSEEEVERSGWENEDIKWNTEYIKTKASRVQQMLNLFQCRLIFGTARRRFIETSRTISIYDDLGTPTVECRLCGGCWSVCSGTVQFGAVEVEVEHCCSGESKDNNSRNNNKRLFNSTTREIQDLQAEWSYFYLWKSVEKETHTNTYCTHI